MCTFFAAHGYNRVCVYYVQGHKIKQKQAPITSTNVLPTTIIKQ